MHKGRKMNTENQVAKLDKDLMGYTPEEVRTIKDVMGFRMNDSDLRVFLHVCRHTNLDPLSKQIYAIPRGGKMTIQTSIDGFRLIADRSGCYAPGKPTEFLYDDKGHLLAAVSYVKKFAGGVWHEIGEQALLCEYMGNTPFWKKMPSVMLSKVAESRALRRAFPADLSGLYTDDEMDQADARGSSLSVATVPKTSISEEEWIALDGYLNGHDDLRKKLCKLCLVDDLRNITKEQLKSCRVYAELYREKISSDKDADTEKKPSEQLDIDSPGN